MEKPYFCVENNEVKIFRGDASSGSLGTLLPNDEQIARVIYRAYELGRSDKAAEVRDVLGVRNV